MSAAKKRWFNGGQLRNEKWVSFRGSFRFFKV